MDLRSNKTHTKKFKMTDQENPNIDYSEVMRHKTAYLSIEEQEIMLNHCLNKNNFSKKRLMHYMLILLLSRTGRRISEIVGEKPYTAKHGLRPVDIHFSDDLIEWTILKKRPIRARKGSRGPKRSKETMRKLKEKKLPTNKLQPIDSKTMKLIKKYVEVNRIGPYDRIIPITRVGAWKIIRRIAKENNIVRKGFGIHPHMFRHGFSINFLKKHPKDPTALIKLKGILEHSSIEITVGYAQFTPQDIKDALNKVFKEEKQ